MARGETNALQLTHLTRGEKQRLGRLDKKAIARWRQKQKKVDKVLKAHAHAATIPDSSQRSSSTLCVAIGTENPRIG